MLPCSRCCRESTFLAVWIVVDWKYEYHSVELYIVLET